LIGCGEDAGPVVIQSDGQIGELRGEELVACGRVVVWGYRRLIAEPLCFEDTLIAAVHVPAFVRPFELCIARREEEKRCDQTGR